MTGSTAVVNRPIAYNLQLDALDSETVTFAPSWGDDNVTKVVSRREAWEAAGRPNTIDIVYGAENGFLWLPNREPLPEGEARLSEDWKLRRQPNGDWTLVDPSGHDGWGSQSALDWATHGQLILEGDPK